MRGGDIEAQRLAHPVILSHECVVILRAEIDSHGRIAAAVLLHQFRQPYAFLDANVDHGIGDLAFESFDFRSARCALDPPVFEAAQVKLGGGEKFALSVRKLGLPEAKSMMILRLVLPSTFLKISARDCKIRELIFSKAICLFSKSKKYSMLKPQLSRPMCEMTHLALSSISSSTVRGNRDGYVLPRNDGKSSNVRESSTPCARTSPRKT
jgi:hypothetical protein